MNFHSIRFHLVSWFSQAFLVTSGVIFVLFFFVTRNLIYSQVDQVLVSHGNKIADIVLENKVDTRHMLNKQLLSDEFSQTPGMYVAILDEKGDILTSSSSANDPTVLKGIYETSIKSPDPVIVNTVLNNSRLRTWSKVIRDNGNITEIIIMGHPLDAIYQSLESLSIIIISAYILLTLPTILGIYLLSRSALRPITNISKDLRRITAENLAQRVTVPPSQDEVSELASSFNSLLDRLNAAFVRERQFIGDVAHELKTPLTIMKGNIELGLLQPKSVSQYQKLLSEALIDINKLSTVLSDVLDLAWTKSEANLSNQTIDLSGLLTDLTDITRKLGASKHLSVMAKITPKVEVNGQKDKLFKALLNLIDNAVKYTPKGNIHLYLLSQDGMATIKIADTGIGISTKELPHIFDRFYRGRNTKTKGSGLGMAIAKSIIEANQGKVLVKSQKNKGTTVYVYLPLSS